MWENWGAIYIVPLRLNISLHLEGDTVPTRWRFIQKATVVMKKYTISRKHLYICVEIHF